MKTRISLVSAVLLSFLVAINVYASDYEAVGSEGKKEGKGQQKAEITYERLKTTLDKHLQENPQLFDSSKGKDIVVFLGKTGSGKSTLINYLSEKELIISEIGDIVLKNPEDKSAMAIGIGARSQTRLPQFVSIDGLLFYDLPGLDDTDGASHELINASFTRHIIEKSRSTRIVTVAGLDEVTSGRGRSFKDLVSRIKGLFPDDINIGKYSSCVITRSDRSGEGLIPYLKAKVDEENLHPWILSVRPRISQMSKPRDKIDLSERKSIISTIMKAEPIEIRKINTKVLYSYEVSSTLKEVLKEEMSLSLNKLVKMIGEQISESEDKVALERIELIKPALFQRQLESDIASSKFIILLKPFLDEVDYVQVLSSLEVVPHTDSLQAKANLKIEKIKAEAEARARIEAEAAAAKAEQERLAAVAKAEEAQKMAEEQRLAAERAEQQRLAAITASSGGYVSVSEHYRSPPAKVEAKAASAEKSVHVNGYHRSDGSYVSEHYRSPPAKAASAEKSVQVSGYYRSNGTYVSGYSRRK